MTLCGQMYDAVYFFVLHQAVECIKIADVQPCKFVVGIVLNISKVGKIACVGQFVEIDNLVLRVFPHEQTDDMTPDKTGPTGNYYSSIWHINFPL